MRRRLLVGMLFSAFSQERDTIFIIEHDTVWMDLQPDAVIESQTREPL